MTNTAAVGGAGVHLALKLLNGETVETDPSATQPNTVLLEPVLADNVTDAGKATLESWQVDGLDPLWPLGLARSRAGPTYTPEQAVACKGRARRKPPAAVSRSREGMPAPPASPRRTEDR